MKFSGRILSVVASLPLLLALCGFGPGATHSAGAPIIVTAAPTYEPLSALTAGERFPRGAQLLLVRNGSASPLVQNFAATADANVSFDGKTVLFAGKRTANDPWKIWEINLADHSVRKVIDAATDAIRPLYLPEKRLVYTRRTDHGFQIEISQLDGTSVLPLTYMAASAVPSDVLADGRILFEAEFPLGAGSTPELFLVYSDGSGVESYRCDHGVARWGGHQLASGDVVFTHGATMARFTSPLAAEARVVAPKAEYAGAIAETADGAWLLSERNGVMAHYALKLWNPIAPSHGGSAVMTSVFSQADEDIVEPVVVAPRTTPKRHPSALHDWDYANLLALDARQSRESSLATAPAAVRLEALDAAGHNIALGTAPVEADGSFFVKAPADRAIRFVLLDEKGELLRQEHGYFWIRRGEQRICVGCHAGPEHAPENRVPAVLLRSTIPVDLSGTIASDATHPPSNGGR